MCLTGITSDGDGNEVVLRWSECGSYLKCAQHSFDLIEEPKTYTRDFWFYVPHCSDGVYASFDEPSSQTKCKRKVTITLTEGENV